MIIVRSPLRITLGGGGTDLASYYEHHQGFVISAAIDKYIYIMLNRTFDQKILLKYSKIEHVQSIAEIQHPIIQAALQLVKIANPHLEITSIADIPAGTGLGSSGSFTTALLRALYAFNKQLIFPEDLAELACHLEINLLREPIGKQDQYIAAFGGITCFDFLKNGAVRAHPLRLSQETLYDLEDNLLLFFTGYSRSASKILQQQQDKSVAGDADMIENLHFIKELGIKSQQALEEGDLPAFAELMNVHWRHKKQRATNMSNPEIDQWYDYALTHGALGGKLIGAGGGGFLMFYANDKLKLRRAMQQMGLTEVRFHFDFMGTTVMVQA